MLCLTEDSTNAVGQSDAIVTLNAPPNKSNKATAVENPPDQASAVEVKSTNDAEATATKPQKAPIDSLSKVEEVDSTEYELFKRRGSEKERARTRDAAVVVLLCTRELQLV
jgi:hypothetical protein